jgi:hypothetical protein
MKRNLLAAAMLCGLAALGAWAANEIQVTTILKVANGSFSLQRTVQNYMVTQAGTAADMGIQSISTNSTVLTIRNVATPRYVFLRNLSTSNITVTVTLRLRKDDVALFPADATNITATATVQNSNLEYWVNAE